MKAKIRKIVIFCSIIAMGSIVLCTLNRPTLTDELNGTFKCNNNEFAYFTFDVYNNTFYYTEQISKKYIKGNIEILNETNTCAAIECIEAANKMIIQRQKVCCDNLSFSVYINDELVSFTKIDDIPTKFYYIYE